uniref:Uncharacterized protein n=1 Tax=Setaria viridis TaxID=4556 RepID=A0A4U6V1D4_SETVI|nr:hypothetical protein SEVIR_4G092800v2 [Setaria viridis]
MPKLLKWNSWNSSEDCQSLRNVEVPLLLKGFSEELTFVDPRNPAGTHRGGSSEELGYLMSLMIP